MRKETASLLGTSVGHIRVVDLIGEGGMGAVFVGFDETLERRVALKVIRTEYRLNPQSKARFLREARILSQLDHPLICTIHDYVAGDDNDVLVMELVDGRSLREAMAGDLGDEAKWSIALQLLDVLGEVHGSAVIHRDLKPENIMITPQGSIKVLDFGLSRSADEDAAFSRAETLGFDGVHGTVGSGAGTDASTYVKTRLGTILGTAGYMSPEQARGEPATAASDMYSVGLILQELFTCVRPFEEGLIGEELVKRAAEGVTLPPTGLSPDLTELITRLKSIAPGARPSSVDAREQVQRIVDKPKRRRKKALVAAVWIVLAVFGLGMAAQSIRASREAIRAEDGERRARREAETARRAADFLVDLFVASTPDEAKGEDVTARELLDRGAARVESDLADEPLIQARLMRAIGMAYRELGLYEQAGPLLERAVETYRRQVGDDHIETASSLYHLASLIQEQGRLEEAERLYVKTLAAQERQLEASDLRIAETLAALGTVYLQLQNYDDCETTLKRSIEIYENVLGDDHPDLSVPLGMLAASFDLRGSYKEAEVLTRRVLEIRENTLEPNHPLIADVLNNLAVNCWYQEEYGEAKRLYERSLAIYKQVFDPGHPRIALATGNLGELYWKTGDIEEAESHLKAALAMLIETYGTDHPDVAYTESVLAKFFTERSRFTEADPLFLHALEVRKRAFGSTHPTVEETLREYSKMLKMAGRGEEAKEARARANAIRVSTEVE